MASYFRHPCLPRQSHPASETSVLEVELSLYIIQRGDYCELCSFAGEESGKASMKNTNKHRYHRTLFAITSIHALNLNTVLNLTRHSLNSTAHRLS